jgi:hypothetical protein
MASKPKKSDYKASQAEKTEARIGAQKAEFFNKTYQPLNVAELKDSLSDDIKNIARGRGNADVMQTLTAKPTYSATQNAGQVAADLSGAYQGQLGKAGAGALEIQNTRAGAAVGVSQGQSADSGSALSKLTNIGVSRGLNKAKNNELLRQARLDAGMKVAGAGMDKFAAANAEKGGKFGGAWKDFRDAYNEADRGGG